MPASPNNQTPRPTTGIRLSSPFLDALQALRANPSKTSEKRTATPKLIPSPEGNTVTAPRRMTYSRAHPRSRGEHVSSSASPRRRRGSSPLAQGTPLRPSGESGVGGLIPTHAGNTLKSTRCMALTRAHPRSRREHSPTKALRRRTWGSSPLTRGALRQIVQLAHGLRLIPAHAGNTPRQNRCGINRRAHPRSRGEHERMNPKIAAQLGSSPLTRGALGVGASARLAIGLIPAHAGSTRFVADARGRFGAHPRSRGEHETEAPDLTTFKGSSPLARGTRLSRPTRCSAIRLIPARAGNTPSCQMIMMRFGAHPRSRGEHCRLLQTPMSRAGSSPLARGTLVFNAVCLFISGLIPARAGNTL